MPCIRSTEEVPVYFSFVECFCFETVLDFFGQMLFLTYVASKMTHILFFFFQSAEIDLHTKCVVDVDANKVILNPVNTNLSKGDAR